MKKDGSWFKNTDFCNGADSYIMSNTACNIPLSVLRQ